MSTKPYESRVSPIGEWVLVRRTGRKTSISVPIGRGQFGSKMIDESRAVVVAIGPGEYLKDGTFVKPDEQIQVGKTIVAMPETFIAPPGIDEIRDEHLAFVPASMIMYVERV